VNDVAVAGERSADPVPESVIEIRDLRAGYGRSVVLHGISVTLGAKAVSVVLGPNGAGKTTLIRAICGGIPARGSLTVLGERVSGRKWTPQGMLGLGIAVVPSGRGTFRDLSVDDNLMAGGSLLRRREARAEADRWYSQFPLLAERRGQRAGLLSGGEQQILAIARALMSRPRFLLLDEPSLGLAPIIVERVYDVLSTLKATGSFGMLIVEQSVAHATAISEMAYLLDGGQLVKSGPAAHIVEDEEVRRVYLGY
jgi:branched-chain amino acid transport system ATP-binding protein